MYDQSSVKGYAISVPKTMQSKFGRSLTSRCRKSAGWNNTYYVVAGAARMETDDKIVIGELNKSAIWINGRLEIEKDSNRILYRKYDEKGNSIKNSTQEFVDFEWIKSSKVKVVKENKKLEPGKKKSILEVENPVAGEKKKSSAEKKNPAPEKKKPATARKKPPPDNYTEFEGFKGTQTRKLTRKSSKVGDGATSSTVKFTGSDAESLLKNLISNLEPLEGNGSSGRTITVTKNTATVGSKLQLYYFYFIPLKQRFDSLYRFNVKIIEEIFQSF